MSGLGDWLDERLGHRAVLDKFLDAPLVGGARRAYVFGSALTLLLVIEVVTGWLLMSAYAASATTAWSSVAYITFEMRAGWIVRGLHHFGSEAMIVLLLVHLGQTALAGAYRKPREMNWLFGVVLFLLTLLFAITGCLLPWDQKGYWAVRAETSIAGTVPIVGGFTQRLIIGGAEFGHLTLARFYSVHAAILPTLMGLLLVAHIALARRAGNTPPRDANLQKVDRYYPKQFVMNLAFGFAVLVVLFALTAYFHGAPLEAPADPGSDYPARPKWYFLALSTLLKNVKGPLAPVGVVGAPLIIFGYMGILPFIDKEPSARFAARLKVLLPGFVISFGAMALTLLSLSHDASDKAYQHAREIADKHADRAIELAKAGVPPEGPLAMLHADPETSGPELFTANCAGCHALGDIAVTGEGKATAPDLTGYGTKAWITAVLEDPDKDALFGLTSLKGNMPSMLHAPKDPDSAKSFVALTPAQVEAISLFLLGEATGKPLVGSAGEKLVSQKCTSCHRLDGKTLDDDSLAPELRGWGSQAYIEAQIADPGNGKAYPKGIMEATVKGHMPGFQGKLSDADIKLLATWVRSRAAK